MDPAFQSRIQVAIEYQDLNPEARRKVWTSLLEKRRATMDAISYGIIEGNLPVLSNHKLNGRQIRNVLNVADGLAFNNKSQVTLKHIEDAVNAALVFQEFFVHARAKNDQSLWLPGQIGSETEWSH